MTDKLCKTCRWWNDTGAFYSGSDNEMQLAKAEFGTCNSPSIRFYCGSELSDLEDLESNHAILADGSGYHAALLPGKDFGCIHHEKKEK